MHAAALSVFDSCFRPLLQRSGASGRRVQRSICRTTACDHNYHLRWRRCRCQWHAAPGWRAKGAMSRACHWYERHKSEVPRLRALGVDAHSQASFPHPSLVSQPDALTTILQMGKLPSLTALSAGADMPSPSPLHNCALRLQKQMRLQVLSHLFPLPSYASSRYLGPCVHPSL